MMTDEERADEAWCNKALLYKVNSEERTYKDGYLDALREHFPRYRILINLLMHARDLIIRFSANNMNMSLYENLCAEARCFLKELE